MSEQKPLTLEELMKMDGKPVYAKLIEPTKGVKEGYVLVYKDNGHAALQRWSTHPLWYQDYGKTWLAYAYEPHRLDRSAWEPCEWCGEWIGGDCRPKEQDVGYTLYAGFCKQVAVDDFWEDETENLNFCPICGRPLTDTAWEMLEKRLESAE